jgi:hypothetical protein
LITQVDERVARFFKCSQYQKARAKEPMIITETSDRPWAKIEADLLEQHGTSYLRCVDYYSEWIEVDKLDDLTSRYTIRLLKEPLLKARTDMQGVSRVKKGIVLIRKH